MEETESSCVILSKLDLDDVEEVVCEAYHRDGSVGRPPRKPIGIFKALIVKRLQQVPSDRELYRRLWNDPSLREVCDLEDEPNPYHPSQLTRFRNHIGTKRLERIMNKMVRKLLKGDAKSELPLAFIVASANENEKRHASRLFDKALRATGEQAKTLVADSQYSSRKLRDQTSAHGVRAIIPYPSNQRRGEKRLLRVDKRFRIHSPANQRRIYRQRAAVERMNSRLKKRTPEIDTKEVI